jgi:type VI secretion system secreted protein Hcp
MAVDMYLYFGTAAKGGDPKGESKDKEHTDDIDVLAWSWGVSNSGTTHMGGGGGSGRANVQDVSVTKYVDKSSPDLLNACCTGKHFPEVHLVCRKAGGKPLEYIAIKMNEVMVTAVSTGGSGGEDRLTENVTLNFAKVQFDYKEQKADGTTGATPSMTYDIAAHSND